MIQQVNLLSTEPESDKQPLVASHVALVWGALVVVLLGVSGWEAFDLTGLKDEALAKEQEIQALKANNALQTQSPTVDLEAQVSRLNALWVEQSQLVALLDENQPHSGFARYLDDLGRVGMKGVWLQKIEIDHGVRREVALRGGALRPELVPEFLFALSNRPSFQGRRFGRIEVTDAEDPALPDGVVDFAIYGPVEDS